VKQLCWKINRADGIDFAQQLWDLRLDVSKGVKVVNLRSVAERKPVPGRAPSWSWASVDAPVFFSPLQEDRLVAELINHQVSPKGKDSMGQVEGGWLVMKESSPSYG
jgi:hypothetical protein